jgi:pseudomonalisin
MVSTVRFLLVFLCLGLSNAFSSTQPATGAQANRVAANPDLRATAILRGHVPTWAVAANDRGAVPANMTVQLTFVLSRSPELQTAFTQLLVDQQNPSSPSYHQWLTPQQVGERFGPTQHDIDALTEWMGSQGLTVQETTPSHVFVRVTGPASSVGSALGTSFHSFALNGTTRMAATVDPSIPAAFSGIVNSITGMAEVIPAPMAHGRAMALKANTPEAVAKPQYTVNSSHFITPGDFAAIFDMKPVYSAGFTGTGQKIAVIGRSRVAASDITEFESNTGLASNVPNVIVPPTGTDPGVTNDGDQSEATLDVERVLGTAPGVQADLVISSASNGGISLAAQYEVQTLLDPVMTISFGSCEAYAGASGVAFWDGLFSQAASEGISVFVSSGDSGAAGCDTHGSAPPAYQFLNISEICSSSYATCVGGTELVEGPGSYWAATNGPGLVTASGYIPEGAWNEPQLFSSSGIPYVVLSGGGGASMYIPKPAWQSGSGVPADGMRDVPDVSFPSAAHDGYYGCYAAGGGDCSAGYYYYFYGTSGGTPSMAGVTALLNQKAGGSQGNLNPLLYRVAASNPNAFHDATPSTISGAVCAIGSAGVCNNSTPSTYLLTNGLAGYALSTGYDEATGLGSLDVANFVNAAAAVAHSTLAATALSLSGSASTITNAQTVTYTATVSSKVAGTPTGSVQFYANGSALGSSVAVVSGSAVTSALPFPAAGSYEISAMYSGDGSYSGSTAPGITLTVTGVTPTVTVTSNKVNVPLGTSTAFVATVTSAPGTSFPTGVVRFYAPGSTDNAYAAVVPLAGGSVASPQITFSYLGNYSMTAEYLGDSVYSAANSTPLAFTVQKLGTLLNIATTGQSIGVNGAVDFSLQAGPSVGTSVMAGPTGTMQMFANGVPVGSPVSLSSTSGSQISRGDAIVSFPSAGTFAVTATYSGDANYMPMTATGTPITVLSTPASYSMSAASSTMTFTAGNTFYNTDPIMVNAALGFTGTINTTCSIVSNGSAANPPTCTMAPSTLNVVPNLSPQLAVVINSVTRSASRPLGLSTRGNLGRGAVEAAVCGMLLWMLPIRRRSLRGLFVLMVFAPGFLVLSGCGNKKDTTGSTPLPPAGTSAGSYTVTVTASSNTSVPAPAPITIALTIN